MINCGILNEGFMINGYLIYNEEDYRKNKWFADELIRKSKNNNINLKLLFSSDISLFIIYSGLSTNLIYDNIDFIINRTRDKYISTHFELLGIRVFNSSLITTMCNDKFLTHQAINSINIKSVDTSIISTTNIENYKESYFPVIIKSLDGHGGTNVHKVKSFIELKEIVRDDSRYIIQDVCSNEGKDIRVFVIGNSVIGSVMRYSNTSFKSNISLGGKSTLYNIRESDMLIIDRILSEFKFDFVGIDFILDTDNNLLFNEIEDVVGCRSLYKNSDIDVANEFICYIRRELCMK